MKYTCPTCGYVSEFASVAEWHCAFKDPNRQIARALAECEQELNRIEAALLAREARRGIERKKGEKHDNEHHNN